MVCSVTDNWPQRGIVISHTDFLPLNLEPKPELFVVEIKPDRHLGSLSSNFVIVQSRSDPLYRSVWRLLFQVAYLPYWPQPSLIPRLRERGSKFENVCFMGNPEQLGVDAQLLKSELNMLGLNFFLVERQRWHDYRGVDAIIAVRPSAPNNKAHMQVNMKPATKLYNAWLAGVPAILSPDGAFEAIREVRTRLHASHDYRRYLQFPSKADGQPGFATTHDRKWLYPSPRVYTRTNSAALVGAVLF